MMNPLGTAFSDVWTDLNLNNQTLNKPKEIIDRVYNLTLTNGEKICFEKDSWIFSEEIIINRGHNLINIITSPNDFYERIAEEPNMRGELTRSEIILT